jgi:hypothetical protein
MLNQQGLGAPSGNPNILSPLQGAIEGYFDKKRKDRGDLRRMVVGHELQSIRDERKFGHERGMLEAKQGHAMTMAEMGMKHAKSEGRAKRKHELATQRLGIAGDVLKQNTAFSGIEQLGKGKRVSNFSATADGGMSVTYNKPTRRRTTPRATGGTSQAPAPASTPSRSTAAPEVPGGTTKIAPVIRDPKTGRATRNPAYTPASTTAPTAKPKAAPKAARKPRSK